MSDSEFNERVRTVLRHDEMVEALKKIIDWHHNPTKYPPYWVRTTFIDKCSQLVAKAEGRQS
jgi:hypothetical protein